MRKITLSDNGAVFDAILLGGANSNCVAVFAVGNGGNPERHLPLLTSLADQGCLVVAPYFERLASPRPTREELLLRARRLRLVLEVVKSPSLPVVGIGHSIGATVLIALAGGQIWMRVGEQLEIECEPRIRRLALMAPSTGFFGAPGALDGINVPISVWVGTDDIITPPAQSYFLKQNLEKRIPVNLHVVEGAGHFSFMNVLPPQVIDPLPDRQIFLAQLDTEIRRYLSNG